MTANDAPPTPPAVTGQGEGGEVLGGSDGTLVCEMARAAQRQLDEWAGSHPDYVGVELPLSVGALRLLTRLPALVAQARAAAEAGADGILLMPPYLTEASQAGLIEHASAVCAATGLGVIVYSRANAILTDVTVARLADRNPTLIGLKDGVGDIEQMTRTYARVADRLIYIGGLPTAETFALPLLQLGVSTYSSALFNFLPEFALGFFADVRAQDRAAVYRKLNDFVLPYIDIRDRSKGYAVSIVKAGLTAIGRSPGPVRPPLVDLMESELAELTTLINKVS